MNEKFNKNAKVEKFTTMLGIAVRLIVIDPLRLIYLHELLFLVQNMFSGLLCVDIWDTELKFGIRFCLEENDLCCVWPTFTRVIALWWKLVFLTFLCRICILMKYDFRWVWLTSTFKWVTTLCSKLVLWNWHCWHWNKIKSFKSFLG